MRKDDTESILRSVPIPEVHPKHISPSTALKTIPKTSDLVEKANQGPPKNKKKLFFILYKAW